MICDGSHVAAKIKAEAIPHMQVYSNPAAIIAYITATAAARDGGGCLHGYLHNSFRGAKMV